MLKKSRALRIISSAQITLSNIYDAYTINLSHSNFDIVCDDNGLALSGEIGPNGKAITTTSVVAGSNKLTAVASNPTAGQYSITISAQQECTAAKSGNDKVYINTLSEGMSGKVSISFNIEGSTTIVKDIIFVKTVNRLSDFIDGKFSFGTVYWSNSQNGTGELGSNVKVVKSKDAIYGTNLLEITNQAVVYSKRAISIENERIYKCRFRAKQSIDNTTGGKIAYFGYTPYNSSDTAIGTHGSNNMYFKNEALKTNEWTEWEYYVSTKAKAEVSVNVNGVKKIITPAVQAFPNNTVVFRPMFIVNYSGGNGIALVDGCIVEDITEQFNISELEHKASQIETNVNGINANVTTIKTYTDMSSNPMTLVAKANYSAYDTPNQGEVYLHGLNDKRNPADVDGKCIWNAKTVSLPKVMFNPNAVVPDNTAIYMVRNISDNYWWSIWKETNNSTTVWKRVYADVAKDKNIYTHTWNEANDIVVGYYIIKKTNPRNAEAPILTAQLFDGALNYKQATSMTLVGSISQLEILENELELKVQKNNVISSINLYTQENESGTTSGVKIRGDKIDLQGQVTFSSLADSNVSGSIKNIFTQQNNKTVIDGGMIKTQTIKGNDLLLKGNMSVTDNNNNKTFEITSNGEVNIQAKSLRIGSSNVATNKDINDAISNVNSGGGVNLATNTNKGTDGWDWIMQSGNVTLSTVVENDIKCCQMSRHEVVSSGSNYIRYLHIGRNKYLPGKQYTVSFEVKSSVATTFNCSLADFNGQNQITTTVEKATVSTKNEWTKLVFTFTTKDPLPSSTEQVLYLTGMDSSVGVTYIFRNLMIEEGTVATTWKPSQLDIDSAIDNKVDNTQEAIFNKLFANGQQGFVLENGKVYINGEVIKANTISGDVIKAGTLDAGKITTGKLSANVLDANTITSKVNEASTTISGDKIKTGVLQANSGDSYLNLNNGSMQLGSTSKSNYLQWTGSSLTIKADAISIGSSALATKSDVTNAVNNMETSIDDKLDDKVDDTQSAIFNRLFANGQQGFTLENGRVYINGEYIKANTISASKITTGTLSANVIKGSTISAINMSTESAKISSAKIGDLDASKITSGTISASRLDASAIVSKINGSSTSINGDRIKTGIIQANSGGSYFNLNNGQMLLGKTSNSNYLYWDGSQLKIKGHLDTCTFRGKNMVYIEDNGTLSCDGTTYIRHLSVLETHPGWGSTVRGSFDCAPTANFAKEVRTKGEFWAANNTSTYLGVIRRGAGGSGYIQIDRLRVVNQKHGSANNYVEVVGYQSNHVFGIDLWSSDEKLKENIVSIEHDNTSLLNNDTSKTGLDLINNLNHYAYDYKKSFGGDHVTCGYVAQELQELNDSLVMEIEQQDGTILLQPKASNIIPNLSLAIKQQQQMIEDLKAEIELLKKQIK